MDRVNEGDGADEVNLMLPWLPRPPAFPLDQVYFDKGMCYRKTGQRTRLQPVDSGRPSRETTMGRRWFRGRLRQLNRRLFKRRVQDEGETIVEAEKTDRDSVILQEGAEVSHEGLIIASRRNPANMIKDQSKECNDPLGNLRKDYSPLSSLFMVEDHHPISESSPPEEEIPLRACFHSTHHQSIEAEEDEKKRSERRRKSLDQERLAHLLF